MNFKWMAIAVVVFGFSAVAHAEDAKISTPTETVSDAPIPPDASDAPPEDGAAKDPEQNDADTTAESDDKTADTEDDGAEQLSQSVGSQDGERLPGLDSMGKVQSAAAYAGAAGELSYQVDMKVPEFRGLEPKLGLVYNSHDTGRSGAASLMGTGWKLKGFSSIERVSARRGAPTYASGKDIFLLDGMEMLKCASSTISVGGQTISYSASHVKSNASVGCSAGGHFTTLNEMYFRIKYNSGANQFEITQKDGTRFIYQSIASLTSSASSDGDYRKLRERRKWLLTRVEDTQSSKNVVTYKYKFDTKDKSWYWQGYPERPHRIEYAGYAVEFHYKQQTTPVATFTTGTKYIGQQWQLLEAVSIKYGTTRVRAYDLSYTTTPITKAKLLKTVKPVGNNFVVNSSGTVSGSGLPPHKFDYNGDGYSVSSRYYNQFENYIAPTKVHNGVHGSTGAHGANTGETFHAQIRTVETNGDGIDEILALDVKPNGDGNPYYRERSGHYLFDKNGNMTRNNAAYAIPTGRFTDGGSYWTFLGMNRWTPSQNRPMAIRGRFYNTGDRRFLEANPLTAGWYNNRQVESADADDRVHWLTGNFDGDPELEVMIRDTIYDVKENANSGTERFPKKTLTRTTDSQCTGRTWVNARVVDLNADGIDDVVYKATEGGKPSSYCRRFVNENGYVDKRFSGGDTRIITCCANVRNLFYWSFGFGDFNGDGVMDSVRFGNVDGYDTRLTSVSQLDLTVAMGYGDGKFTTRQTWKQDVDILGMSGNGYFANAVIPTDLNGDGLDDVIVFAGYDDDTYSWKKRKYAQPIRMFLSTGTGFVEQKMFPGGALIRQFGTVGDFNGDGVQDLAFGSGSNSDSDHRPRIMFGNSKPGHRITKITTPLGEAVTVSYKPSTHFVGDQTPFVRQLVHRVTSNPGVGSTRTVEFKYKNGRYDYAARKPLGFQEIEAKLPRIPGETADLIQVTQYKTGHIAELGLVNRQFVKYGSTIYQDTQNTWSVVKSGRGPYRTLKTQERMGNRHGNRVIYKRKDFTYDGYNNVLTEIDRGFDGTPDDTSTAYRYFPNTSGYIVNKVAMKAVLKGNTATTSVHPNRMLAEFYGYDGRAWNNAPTRGNATTLHVWGGNPTSNSARRMKLVTFDAYGNATSEANARNYATQYTFTGPRALFESTSTNAKGHRTTTVWNYGCQKPLKVTDPNGLITSYTYDAHCRETLKRVAWGTSGSQMQDLNTRYNSFGTANAQYVQQYQKSSNTTSGQTWAYTRKYFDGLGKVYKETQPGGVSAISASSVTVRRYDQRGNLSWESIPISWADSTDNVANSNQRETYTYDPLGRMTRTTYADGARMELSYSNYTRTVQGQTTYFPQVNSKSPECFDSSSKTVCQEVIRSVDADDNAVIVYRADRALSDTDSGSGVWRSTYYEYDTLNRLTRVVDPGGLIFKYKYDSYGNRIEQDDPGLGRWRLEYYADNTVKRQIDAKGQEIYFWYDELAREERKRVQRKNAAGSVLSTTNTYSRYDGEGSTVAGGYYYKGFLTKQWTDGPDAHTIENRHDRRGLVTWQNNTVNGKTYNWLAQYTVAGHLSRQTYFYNPGATSRKWTPVIAYDTADRQVRFGSYITGTSYDRWGNMTSRQYGNGARSAHKYSPTRGWVTEMRHYNTDNANVAFAIYTKSVGGRVQKVNSANHEGDLEYTYDYAGRLLKARYYGSQSGIGSQVNQTFTYDRAGRMRSNSKVGVYEYTNAKNVTSNGNSIYGHAPRRIVPSGSVSTQNFAFDDNGNMTTGLNGKTMTYDGENRPLSVTYQGKTTRYAYGADGTRLKKTERAGTSQQSVTVYMNGTEIRNFGQGSTKEEMVTHLADEVRISHGGGANGRLDYLHYDQLGSVIGITNAAGKTAERRAYLPFGKVSYERVFDASLKDETKGFVGERYDADAGLQFLNARYYDPELGLFLQPDWFEVTEAGVGTNRYSYSFNDPVNLRDPDGNAIPLLGVALLAWNAFSTVLGVLDTMNQFTKVVAALATGNPAAIGSAVLDIAIDAALDRIPFGGFLKGPVRNFLGRVGITPDWVGNRALQIHRGENIDNAIRESDFSRANTGPVANQIRGAEFENWILQQIDAPKNNQVLSTSVARTIPDAMGRNVGGMLEVKDVRNLRNTRQMRSQVAAALDADVPLNLVLGPSNQRIAPALREAIEGTGGTIIRYRSDLSGWDPL